MNRTLHGLLEVRDEIGWWCVGLVAVFAGVATAQIDSPGPATQYQPPLATQAQQRPATQYQPLPQTVYRQVTPIAASNQATPISQTRPEAPGRPPGTPSVPQFAAPVANEETQVTLQMLVLETDAKIADD